MERQAYVLNNQVQTLLQSFPGGAITDDVVYSIFDVDDAATDVGAVAMTNIDAENWKASWTPTETHSYIITFFNRTQDVKYYFYAKVLETLTFVPGGAGVGSTLSTLRTRFLKLIDNYNANDLTGTNSSGEVADLCINDGLQNIYSIIKASRHLDAYEDTSLISTANQAYISLSTIADLDEIVAIQDTTNNITLQCITPAQYFSSVPNPATVTGTPSQYCRIFNRIYLNARPTAAITYTTRYKKTYARLSNDNDQALIPTKFDRWIMAEAWVIWLMGEDINATAAIQVAQAERERVQEIYLNDIGSDFDLLPQAASHWDREFDRPRGYPYVRPI